MSGLIVTLFGTVHQPDCKEVPGMTWAWEGRNNLRGDLACPACLPDGLPENEHWTPTAEEAADLRALIKKVSA